MLYYIIIYYIILYPPTPQRVERVETTLNYNHDNYSDYNYSLYWFTPPTPLGTQPPPLTFPYGWVNIPLTLG